MFIARGLQHCWVEHDAFMLLRFPALTSFRGMPMDVAAAERPAILSWTMSMKMHPWSKHRGVMRWMYADRELFDKLCALLLVPSDGAFVKRTARESRLPLDGCWNQPAAGS